MKSNQKIQGDPVSVGDLSQLNYSLLSSLTPYLINKREEEQIQNGAEYGLNSGIVDEIFTEISQKNSTLSTAQLDDIFGKVRFKNGVYIPTKLKRVLSKCSVKMLKEIHPDKEVAKELIIKFTSFIPNINFINKFEKPECDITLYSSALKRIFGNSHTKGFTYTKIIKFLKHYKVINVHKFGNTYTHAGNVFELQEQFFESSQFWYMFKTDEGKKIHLKDKAHKISLHFDNPIIKAVLDSYSSITLPDEETIQNEAVRLVSEGVKNNKGFTYRFQHGKSKKTFPDKTAFIEDQIEIYNKLTKGGLYIPVAGSEESGNRIVDSFTLMPSWIRKLCLINGESICEKDFTALHPNIAITQYGTDEEAETINGDIHTLLAETFYNTRSEEYEKYSIDDYRKVIKIENLSFWNKKEYGMKKSILWDMYSELTPVAVQNCIEHKKDNHRSLADKHKITSQLLFTCEVDIMAEVCSTLHTLGISIIYVYDAIYCSKSDSDIVKEIMNRTITNFGYNSYVK